MLYFAWVADGTVPFNNVTHKVEQAAVYSMLVEHGEGDFAVARLLVRNPALGEDSFLEQGKTWLWISHSVDGIVAPTPMFLGRLTAVPEDTFDEVSEYEFQARPNDYEEVKAALAATMRVAPYWDPIWFGDEDLTKPDAVLEARTALWHIDRVTHEVTASDLIVGDSMQVFQQEDHYDEGSDFTRTIGQVPASKVIVRASAYWTQFAQGEIDLIPDIKRAFEASMGGEKIGHAGMIRTFSPDGFSSDWPQEGNDFGGGWQVGQSDFQRVDGLWFETRYYDKEFQQSIINEETGAYEGSTKVQVGFALGEFDAILTAAYEASREREDVLEFELKADVQRTVTDTEGDDVVYIDRQSANLSVIRLANGDTEPVIGASTGLRAYFPTDRGLQSANFLVTMARSTLLLRSRVVEIGFRTSIARGLELTGRESCTVYHPTLPGGSAVGKVMNYTLRFSGEGQQDCMVTIGCVVGQGNTVEPNEGAPTYAVDDAYADDGVYQFWIDRDTEAAEPGEVYFSMPAKEPEDDGLDLTRPLTLTDVKIVLEVINGPKDQIDAIDAIEVFDRTNAYKQILQENYTEVNLELKPVEGGPFVTPYTLAITDLMIPRNAVV